MPFNLSTHKSTHGQTKYFENTVNFIPYVRISFLKAIIQTSHVDRTVNEISHQYTCFILRYSKAK